MDSAANYIYTDIILEGKIIHLRSLLKAIQEDYDNSAYDYLQKQCRNATDLEGYIKEYSHMFIVENSKVARHCESLESGKKTIDKYFEDILKKYASVSVTAFAKFVDGAPEDIKNFIRMFYPEGELKKYFKRRPNMFFVRKDQTVSLTERESVEFFKRMLKHQQGIRFMNLRGNVGQAPQHVRKHVNDHYPGTEFLCMLDKNSDVFHVDSNGSVFLVK